MNLSSPTSFPLSVIFHSGWGVTTGTGVAGGVDSVAEKDKRGLPIVHAAVLVDVMREQSLPAVQVLGDNSGRSQRAFASALSDSDQAPRLVTFSDARLIDPPADPVDLIHKVVSLPVDEKTGVAREDFLRLFGHAGACRLRGEVTLSDVDQDGRPLAWNDEQCDAAELLLALAGLLVHVIDSNRAVDDGVHDVLVRAGHESGGTQVVKDQCRTQLNRQKGHGTSQPPAVDTANTAAPVLQTSRASAATGTFHEMTLTIDLRIPVVSYEVPMSNEIHSLDFLRDTVLLSWIHRLIARIVTQAPSASETLIQEVRDAVVNGELFISDGVISYRGERGLAVPLVFPSPKIGQGAINRELKTVGNESDEETCVCGRMRTKEPEYEVHKPLRSGYVFPTVGARGAPAPVGRQSTAHDAAAGAARDGQLHLVRALLVSLSLQAMVIVSTRLYQQIGEQLKALAGAGHRARLGARRLSGTSGKTECTLSAPALGLAPQVIDAEDMTIWFTSDVLVRPSRLSPGGSLTDLLAVFKRTGTPIELTETDRTRFNAGIRHRRVDSWSATSHQPRATHIAIQAGSVLKVRTTAPERLAALVAVDIGGLRTQGFGRFVVGHPLLEKETFALKSLHREGLAPTADGAATSKEAQR